MGTNGTGWISLGILISNLKIKIKEIEAALFDEDHGDY